MPPIPQQWTTPSFEEDLVSVIMPAYNAERYILHAIQSVQAQGYSNFECIVVDDHSSDSTVATVKLAMESDSRIKLFSTPENLGAAAARNLAISNAKGRYLAFLDADDLWLPEKLETQLDIMKRANIAFSFSAYRVISADGSPLYSIVNIPESISYNELLKNTIIGCLTVMIDRKQFQPIKFPALRTRQDLALWLELLRDGKIAHGIPQILSLYRITSDSLSRNKFRAAKQVWFIYRNIEKLSFTTSVISFFGYGYRALSKHYLKTGQSG